MGLERNTLAVYQHPSSLLQAVSVKSSHFAALPDFPDFLNTFQLQIKFCNAMILLIVDWFGSWLIMLKKTLNPYGKNTYRTKIVEKDALLHFIIGHCCKNLVISAIFVVRVKHIQLHIVHLIDILTAFISLILKTTFLFLNLVWLHLHVLKKA